MLEVMLTRQKVSLAELGFSLGNKVEKGGICQMKTRLGDM